MNNARFGTCETYGGGVEVCAGLVRRVFDRIYIFKNHGNFSSILNNKMQRFQELFATHDKDCVDQVYRVMCRYYLPPCGNFTHPLPPTSICQEECSQVQSKCPETWQFAAAVLAPYPFINCDDTSELLFPLPNCCTGAGILTATVASISVVPTPTPSMGRFKHAFWTTCKKHFFPPEILPRSSSGVDSGIVAGAVIGTLAISVLVAIAVVVVLVMMSRKLHKKKQLERMQMDILAL